MRIIFILITCMATIGLSAQSKKVTESIALNGQTDLDLQFDFADDIVFKTWDKPEILVEVDVEINEGEYNDIFTMKSFKTSSTVYVEIDKNMWNKVKRNWKNANCWQTNIDYTVYLPEEIEVEANTISGNYECKYFGSPLRLKTISGVIDMTIPANESLDFKAETISGEVYTDIEIAFPYGKEGLRQIVGQKFRGRISTGGPQSQFETISGNIYLRKG